MRKRIECQPALKKTTGSKPKFGERIMAINLISDVMKMASPAIIDRIASAFGLNPSMVQTVLASAVPAIFAGVSNRASTPGGLTNVLSSLGQVNPNLMSNLAGPMTGGAENPLVKAGTDMLSSVLGTGTLGTIVSSITKSSGVSAAAGSSLVALAGQMAMSTLASHASGLDASGLGSLLKSQASHINAAMPASLATSLGSAANTATSTMQSAPRQAASNGGNWMMWLIPVLAVAAALWYFLGMQKPMAEKPVAQTTTEQTAPAAATNMMIDNVDITKTLTDATTGLTTTLATVTDATTAQAAVAKIAEASKGIASVSALTAKFTPEQKSAVAALVSGSLPALNTAVTTAEALPGVGDILKPVIGPLLDQLTALTK
jgi:Bacterial protein of unknown function (DUF937)